MREGETLCKARRSWDRLPGVSGFFYIAFACSPRVCLGILYQKKTCPFVPPLPPSPELQFQICCKANGTNISAMECNVIVYCPNKLNQKRRGKRGDGRRGGGGRRETRDERNGRDKGESTAALKMSKITSSTLEHKRCSSN